MRVNELRRKLSAGEIVVGSFAYLPSARFVEILGLIGFDFVVIDMEHGPVDMTMAEDMVRAAETSGTTPIIRVSHNSPHLTLRALDVGAAGVHIPEVNDAADARLAAESCRYGPAGRRGLAGVRAAEYGLTQSLSEYAAAANREVMCIAHIESVTAVENLDALLAVDDVSVFYLGPEDLSNSLGIPGQSKDQRVVKLVEDSIRRIAAKGRVAGCIAADAGTARRYIDLGARYIACHGVRFMANASRQFIAEVRQ
jgi:4-hydroxy-2-oxoheptanedioate aldolase